jgi:hypothetical protein
MAFVSNANKILSIKLKEAFVKSVAGVPLKIVFNKKGSVINNGEPIINRLLLILIVEKLSFKKRIIVGITIISVGILSIVPTAIIKNK